MSNRTEDRRVCGRPFIAPLSDGRVMRCALPREHTDFTSGAFSPMCTTGVPGEEWATFTDRDYAVAGTVIVAMNMRATLAKQRAAEVRDQFAAIVEAEDWTFDDSPDVEEIPLPDGPTDWSEDDAPWRDPDESGPWPEPPF